MDRSVDDEHRAGLRGEIRVRPLGEKTFRREDASCAVADVENAVRLLKKFGIALGAPVSVAVLARVSSRPFST